MVKASKTIPVCDEHHKKLKLVCAHGREHSMQTCVSRALDEYFERYHKTFLKAAQSVVSDREM